MTNRRPGRTIVKLTGCVLALLAFADAAAAQRELGRADLRVLAGLSWSSPWLDAGGTTVGIGWNPGIGASGTYWWTPRLGTRLHLVYARSGMPEPAAPGTMPVEDRRLHTWYYDLSVAARPFAGRAGRSAVLPAFYVFLGAGAFTANPEGVPQENCAWPYDEFEACLANDWRAGTVGQATTGGGLTFLPLAPGVGLFAEAAVHFHSSPFHLGPEWTGFAVCAECRGGDRWVVTPRLVGGLAFTLGSVPGAAAAPRPLPPPAPAAPLEERRVSVCVVVDGIPRRVDALFRPAAGDTVVVGEHGVRRPLRSAYPTAPLSASGREWFVRNESVFVDGREHARSGPPREVPPEALVRRGEYRGVPVYVPAPGAAASEPVIYLPVNDGCSFQPYLPAQRPRGPAR